MKPFLEGSGCFVSDGLNTCNGRLTHWGRVTHICISKICIIGLDNGLSPARRQAIIWTNAEILLMGLPGTNFNEILIEIHKFSFEKIHLKMSGKWRPPWLGLNVLTLHSLNWKKWTGNLYSFRMLRYTTELHVTTKGSKNNPALSGLSQ